MIININKFILVSIVFSLFVSSCDNLEEFNVNDRNITDEQLLADFQSIGSNYRPIFENIYRYDPAWKYQLQQNLNADVYSGYMTNPRPFRSGANNTTYNLVGGWNDFIWTIPYSNIMNNVNTINELTLDNDDFKALNAVNKVLKVEAMHRVTDVFGPIVYSNFGDFENAGIYDSQEDVYTTFFSELDATVDLLYNVDDKAFQPFDMVYGNQADYNYKPWAKFANSLRLRLAIRISNVDPEKARIEGEKALASSAGLLESNADNFVIHSDKVHPLSVIDNSWGDIRMNASMESILKGYGDSRMEKFFDQSGDYPGDYKGIRNGLPLQAGYADELEQKAAYVNFSALNGAVKDEVVLMTAAEVYFLKAEAALRGWAGAGDMQSNYELGITTSFDQHGAGGASAYINDNTSTAIDYVDPVNDANSIVAASNITIAWDDAADNETKLERIITQKWIAMYPEGEEAWSEYRRTGYPKLFPVVSNQSGGTIDTNIQIRRIPFAISELSSNASGVAGAVSKLGGADNGGTRLWWDTGSNF